MPAVYSLRAWFQTRLAVVFSFAMLLGLQAAMPEIVVTNDLVLDKDARLSARLVVRATENIPGFKSLPPNHRRATWPVSDLAGNSAGR